MEGSNFEKIYKFCRVILLALLALLAIGVVVVLILFFTGTISTTAKKEQQNIHYNNHAKNIYNHHLGNNTFNYYGHIASPQTETITVKKDADVHQKQWECYHEILQLSPTLFSHNGYGCHSCRAIKQSPLNGNVYFELRINSVGHCNSNCIAIGFSDEAMPLSETMVGNLLGSSSAFTSNGKYFGQNSDNTLATFEYDQLKFHIGDVVGIGFHVENREMFFTKNGMRLKIMPNLFVKSVTFRPTISLANRYDEVEVNLGPRFMHELRTGI